MRKVWLCLLTAVLIIPILCCGASAEEYADLRDSRYISPETFAGMHVSKESFLKAYACSLRCDFGECDNIEEVLERCNDPQSTVYIVKDVERPRAYLYLEGENGNYEMIQYSNVVNYASVALREFQTMEAISTVSPDIVIKSIYFFYGLANYEGNAIYYKTNLGDYVYYCAAWGNPQMLFTAKRFFEYQWAEYDGYRTGDSSYLDWDLSAYDYRSPKFNPAAPLPNSKGEQLKLFAGIAIVILLPAAAVTVYMTKRKKRVQESAEL